jgi:DNA mismatch repair ATPase MutS
MHDPEALFTWAGRVEGFYRKPAVIFALRLLPVMTIVIGIVTLLRPESKYYALIAALLIQFLILKINGKKRGKNLGVASGYTDNIAAYARMLRLLETEKFSSPYLQGLKKRLKDDRGQMAYAQIHKLVKIVESMSNRYNAFYFIFNILFLLDYQFMFALEKWKEKSDSLLRNWLETLGELESLSSLAVLMYDHPEWALPEFLEGMPSSKGMPLFAAGEMGHPLLSNSCITNDLQFKFPQKILLITGPICPARVPSYEQQASTLFWPMPGQPSAPKSFPAP